MASKMNPGAAPQQTQAPGWTPTTYNPTMVDTSAQDAIYKQMLDKANESQGFLRQNAGMASSSALRRNASLAAMSGASVGGGSYLSGQRQAVMSGQQATRDAELQSNQNFQNVFNTGYGGAQTAARDNASFTNDAGSFNANQTNSAARDQWAYNNEVNDRTADAGAQAFANQKTTDLGRFDTLIDQNTTVDTKKKRGQEYEEYSALATAAQNASTQEEYQAAIAALEEFYQRKKSEFNNRENTQRRLDAAVGKGQ
jgi:hypothetical protein